MNRRLCVGLLTATIPHPRTALYAVRAPRYSPVIAPFPNMSLGRGRPENREFAQIFTRNLSLSPFSFGRDQRMNLGFMRVLTEAFDVNIAFRD